MTEKKKVNMMIVISSLVIAILGMLVIMVWIFVGERIRDEYMTLQTKEYGNWDGHIEFERESLESGLYLFPEKISTDLDSDYFYYCASDYHSINSYLIYAKVDYTEEKFQKEVERIVNTKCEVRGGTFEEGVTNSVMYSEELFAYPAYIAIYSSNLSYEYTLIDKENNRIIYIYLQMKDGNGIIPDEYLPINTLGKDMYENNSWDNQNIYFYKDNYGDYLYYRES